MSEAMRNSLVGEEDCLKPSLAELKLEPDTDSSFADHHALARKSDKIRQIVNEHTSAESQKMVDSILDQVGKLTALDKLLLYLKLPGGRPGDVDPLRQPLNPLGSRSEIQLTINWIRTHLEEDPQVSLPKHEVYDEYIGYCGVNSVKPLSTADFGKVMKQVYPQVRPRRLGTRGNSRYCYAGLRKRVRLEGPLTPDIGAEGRKEGCESEEDLNSAASFIIREWVEKLLGVKFETLTDLAFHLLEKMYVDNRSVAAFTLLSSAAKFSPGGKTSFGLTSPGQTENKHRDTQLQLQRKLQERDMDHMDQMDQQQREGLDVQHRGTPGEQKRKLPEHQEFQPNHVGGGLLIGKRSKLGGQEEEMYVDQGGGQGEYEGGDSKVNCDIQQRYSVVVTNNQNTSDLGHFVVNGAGQDNGGFEPSSQPQDFTNYVRGESSDRLELPVVGQHRPPSSISMEQHRPPSSISLDKLPRKKQALVEAASLAAQGVVCLDSGIQMRGLDQSHVRCLDPETGQSVILNHTSVIKAGEKPKNKYKEVQQEEGGHWGDPKGDLEVKSDWDGGGVMYDEPADLTTLGRVGSWDKGLLGGSGGSSSDNQEEELVRYFSQTEVESNGPEDNKSEKLSQLRQLLEKNLKSPTNLSVSGGGAFKRTTQLQAVKEEGAGLVVSSATDFTNNIEPALPNSAINLNTNLSTRRRVSFVNPLIVSDPAAIVSQAVSGTSGGSSCPVPPSPGSRRRHFSFQPISPRQSLPQSPPASPFISPRSTPVHMLRSRHSSGSGLPLHLLPGNAGNGNGRQQHPSGSGSDISRAATFGSASESSTPFISPQGTPIPFNRSRHNSAQGRLCPRSRHSSGVPLPGSGGGYRYQTMPYSPMALNNLNNPFSPQPATPVCQDTGAPGPEGPIFPTPPQASQFVSPGGEDPRSRHSSAGSDTAPRSAPLSPFSGGGGGGGARQRHQSAGQLPVATATIHYRPPASWQQQVNGEQQTGLEGEFSTEDMLPEISDRVSSYGYSQSQPPTPGSGNGFSYQGGGVVVTNTAPQPVHHSTYNNTVTPGEATGRLSSPDQEFGEGGDLGTMEEGKQKRNKDNDDLDLALDALRDCDTDFNKFVQEVGSTVNN